MHYTTLYPRFGTFFSFLLWSFGCFCFFEQSVHILFFIHIRVVSKSKICNEFGFFISMLQKKSRLWAVETISKSRVSFLQKFFYVELNSTRKTRCIDFFQSFSDRLDVDILLIKFKNCNISLSKAIY